ncbi:MAG: GNAT family N-acetyltransferase [Clostridia bacterium]|nr:GNAT family N-acetyltransferase [Clostridia bacterium]
MEFFKETAHLTLCAATAADAEVLAAKRSTPFVMRYNLYTPCDKAQMAVELETYPHILLKCRKTGEIIGAISIRDDDFRYHIASKELVAWLTDKHAHKGLMAEALPHVMAWVFDNGAERIAVRIFADNTASHRLAEKLGFTREGYLTRAVRNAAGEVFDVLLYSISKEDFSSK